MINAFSESIKTRAAERNLLHRQRRNASSIFKFQTRHGMTIFNARMSELKQAFNTTPLINAVIGGHFEVVKFLLSQEGININFKFI